MNLLKTLKYLLANKVEPHPVTEETKPEQSGSVNTMWPMPTALDTNLPTQLAEDEDLGHANDAIRTYLVPLGARWAIDFMQDETREIDNGIKKVYEEDTGLVYLLLPSGTLVKADDDGFETYDLDDPAAVTWLFEPVTTEIQENSAGQLMAVEEVLPYGMDSWLPAPAAGTDDDFVIGGSTDFYAREGLWPHRLLNGEQTPLEYTARFLYGGEIYYFFYDLKEEEEFYPRDEYPDYKQDDMYFHYALFSKNPDIRVVQPWITMMPLTEPENLPIGDPVMYVHNGTRLMGPSWIQSSDVPEAPFNHFVVEIQSTGVYGAWGEIMFGDVGSIYVFTDNRGNFRTVFQCT